MTKTYELNKKNHYLIISESEGHDSPNEWGNEDMFLVYDHRQFNIEREGFKPTMIYNWLQSSEKEKEEHFVENYSNYWIFPVYAYIHSGISLSLGNSEYPFNCNWDTSMRGYILVEKEKYIEGNLPIITTKPEAKQYAKGLISSWNQYLSGEVYKFEIIKKVTCECCNNVEEESLDSCCGFYGELNDDLIEEMLSHTEYKLKENG